MKRILFIVPALCALILGACKEKNPETKMVSATFALAFPEDNEAAAAAEYSVTLSNVDTKYEETKTTDAAGQVTFAGLVPGVYNAVAAAEVADPATGFTYVCSGSLNRAQIVEDGKTYTITIAAVKGGSLIFKEMYWTGCKTPSGGKYFRDQFYELYNNSTQTVWADGLCIGNLMPEQATGLAVYDWQIADPENHVFFHTILQVPGTPGVTRNYPVKPGESIILAQWGVNHQRDDLNPASPVDLSGAEFEYYNPNNTSVTDEAAINMTLVYRAVDSELKQWLVTVFAGAYAIFYPDRELLLEERIANSTVGIWSSTEYYAYAVSVNDVLDAVELMKNESQKGNKRVPAVLDAGYFWITPDDPASSDSSYSGYGITRKIKEMREDGTIVLQDTNNTSADFEQVTPQVHRYGVSSPSWNTWAK